MSGLAPGGEHLDRAGAALQETCCLRERGSHFHWLEKQEHQLESLTSLSLGVPVADLPAFPEWDTEASK